MKIIEFMDFIKKRVIDPLEKFMSIFSNQDHQVVPAPPKLYCLVIMNDDFHTWEEVVVDLTRELGKDADAARFSTWEVDRQGQSVIFHGSEQEVSSKSEVFRNKKYNVEVREL